MEYIKKIWEAFLYSFRLLWDSVVLFLSGIRDVLLGLSEMVSGVGEMIGSIIAICFPFFALWVLFTIPIFGIGEAIREKKIEDKNVLWLAPLLWFFIAFLLIFVYPGLVEMLLEKMKWLSSVSQYIWAEIWDRTKNNTMLLQNSV